MVQEACLFLPHQNIETVVSAFLPKRENIVLSFVRRYPLLPNSLSPNYQSPAVLLCEV